MFHSEAGWRPRSLTTILFTTRITASSLYGRERHAVVAKTSRLDICRVGATETQQPEGEDVLRRGGCTPVFGGKITYVD
jgi:hypothetical protein